MTNFMNLSSQILTMSNCQPLTDTDSFLFSCKIPKGETVASLLKKHEDHFDFSNLSKNGKLGKELFSMEHKNQLNR